MQTLRAKSAGCLAMIAILLGTPCGPAAALDDSYHVGPGDELDVSMPLQGSLGDLSKLSGNLPIEIVGEAIYWHLHVLVGPDGSITLPSAGRLVVAGSTLADVQTQIRRVLNLPPRFSRVSVSLGRPNSHAFYVWGEVKQPGRFVFDRPTSVMAAIGQAGGVTEYARRKHVILLRPGQRTGCSTFATARWKRALRSTFSSNRAIRW